MNSSYEQPVEPSVFVISGPNEFQYYQAIYGCILDSNIFS